MTPELRAGLLAALAWQIELGCDEALAETPADRFAAEAARLAARPAPGARGGPDPHGAGGFATAGAQGAGAVPGRGAPHGADMARPDAGARSGAATSGAASTGPARTGADAARPEPQGGGSRGSEAAGPGATRSGAHRPAAARPAPARDAPGLAGLGGEAAAAQAHAAALAAGCDALDALHAALAAFDGCALKLGARSCVFADGLAGARVMVIGEAPGRDEDIAGKPFVGRSGQLLDRMLACIGLDRRSTDPASAVYIANTVPWRPVDNRTPSADETALLAPFLRRQIALAAPEVLLLTGAAPARALLGSDLGITRLRGRWGVVDGRPALPTLHPAYLLRNPAAKRQAWADLLALRAVLDGAPPPAG